MSANEKMTGAESASVTKTKVKITAKVGDKVKLACEVVAVDKDSITLEIADGIETNSHRLTLTGAQAAALK